MIGSAAEGQTMECKQCGEEADELFPAKIDGRRRKICENCMDLLREQEEITEAAESAIQDMMGYKGRF